MEYQAQYTDGTQVKKKPMKISLPAKIGLLVVYIVMLGIYIYATTPVLNPIYQESYGFIVVNILIILLIIFSNKLNTHKVRTAMLSVIGISILFFIVLNILSSPIINSQKYYNLIGDVKEYNYEDVKTNVDTDLIPVVDYELAQKLGDKVLGEDLGLGSQYDIGEYYLISTPDDLAWVAPLEPQNFFKWVQNSQGSPGYIYVSATNPNDVRLVKDINGQEIHLKYTEKSYFNRKIKRYAYLHGNMTKGLTDYSFEIDDAGNPYWIITKYKPTIGFSGFDVSGIVVVDAQTGELKNYEMGDEDIPKWIDRIYPKSMIRDQLQYYGEYKNGWLNTVTAQKEMIKPTSGISYIFIDGKPYFYTGMTSIKSDESTVGFIIHSTALKETAFFKVNGATESAAQKSAQGKVQQYNYVASLPILLDIYNKPTYFMTLKDSDGLVKQYAFVSVENYNIVGIGSNVEDAKRDYYEQLKDNNTLDTSVVGEKEKTAKIDRINYINKVYYFTLEGSKEIFVVDEDSSSKLVLTQPQDEVTIKYIPDETNDYTQVTSFTNNSF